MYLVDQASNYLFSILDEYSISLMFWSIVIQNETSIFFVIVINYFYVYLLDTNIRHKTQT